MQWTPAGLRVRDGTFRIRSRNGATPSSLRMTSCRRMRHALNLCRGPRWTGLCARSRRPPASPMIYPRLNAPRARCAALRTRWYGIITSVAALPQAIITSIMLIIHHLNPHASLLSSLTTSLYKLLALPTNMRQRCKSTHIWYILVSFPIGLI